MPGWSGVRLDKRRWAALKAYVMIRDNRVCQIQLPVCTTVATQVDHIVPIILGGSMYSVTNVRAACAPCNSTSGGSLARPAGRLGKASRQWR